ncbi:MAG: DinB family protein [Terracidiphilus sp.]|jgi:uncharacterized damage-inducible protein DinB
MTPDITLAELLAWNDEASNIWKKHLDANPALLALPCDIGGTTNVQGFVSHIWGVELRWSQRLAGLQPMDKEKAPQGPLDVLFGFHTEAMENFRSLLKDGSQDWEETMTLDLPQFAPEKRIVSRRKVAAHALFHSQRHWAQLATLVRAAGFPSGFFGDILLSSALT